VERKFIVALGASSGGIAALSEFFDHTLPDGLSYIITTHLDPNYRSHLRYIIQKRSKIEVCTVYHDMKIEPNIVYVMPENKTMTINDGKLMLKPRDLSIRVNKAIDIFFISLAEDTMYDKIAIILSGMGDDGTKGIEALSQKGGYVIAQTLLSADESSMPHSVINSGYVDDILDPKDMPDAIISYVEDKIKETGIDQEDQPPLN
jgi:two-component system CheB/CheR fusion protein